MSHPQSKCIATSTGLAVKKVAPPANTAYATLVAVVLLLCGVVIKEFARKTGISTELDTAVCALLGDRLPKVANGTHNLLHLFAFYFMPQFRVLRRGRMVQI